MRVCTCRGSCSGPEKLADGWTCALSDEYRKSLERITQYECEAAMEKEAQEWVAIRDRLMRRVAKLEAALRDIAAPHDCGCCPCTGACVSQEALRISLDEFREIAQEALNP